MGCNDLVLRATATNRRLSIICHGNTRACNGLHYRELRRYDSPCIGTLIAIIRRLVSLQDGRSYWETTAPEYCDDCVIDGTEQGHYNRLGKRCALSDYHAPGSQLWNALGQTTSDLGAARLGESPSMPSRPPPPATPSEAARGAAGERNGGAGSVPRQPVACICGASNALDGRFCAECGEPLWESCFACDAMVAASDKHCRSCGADLKEERRRRTEEIGEEMERAGHLAAEGQYQKAAELLYRIAKLDHPQFVAFAAGRK